MSIPCHWSCQTTSKVLRKPLNAFQATETGLGITLQKMHICKLHCSLANKPDHYLNFQRPKTL